MYSTWAGSWRSIFFFGDGHFVKKDGKIFNQEIITWSMNFKKEQTFFSRFNLGFVKSFIPIINGSSKELYTCISDIWIDKSLHCCNLAVNHQEHKSRFKNHKRT